VRLLTATVLVLLLASASSCGGDDDPAGTVTVFAAASLTDVFTEIAEAFEAANPGVDVELDFAGSSSLREQILAGAPADVFASADPSILDAVVTAGAAEEPTVFATNELQIAVPAGNPAGVAGLADFAEGDLLLGLCAVEVPCGELGRETLTRAGVTPSIDTDEPDVRSLLTKVEARELDAGIVYRTDVLAAGDAVDGIAIPPDQNVVATYPIATLADAADAELTGAFVAFVLSDDGRSILAARGFGPPA
jgi:molybdate transport system substrate-binding protein